MKTKLTILCLLLALLGVNIACNGGEYTGYSAKIVSPSTIDMTFASPPVPVVTRDIALYQETNEIGVYTEIYILQVDGKGKTFTLNYPLYADVNYLVYYKDNYFNSSSDWYISEVLNYN